MLVASRDPFHGAHDNSPAPGTGNRLARTMGALQIVGTILAIPVGLGSAYSMYKANFSSEASCRSLRSNIILILDKGVDASARHMLVRRDVEAFEQTCGSVDPDAAAAFKTLLAVDKTAASGMATPIRRVEAQPKAVERKAEPKVDVKVEAKIEPKAEPKVETKQPAVKAVAAAPVQRDPATSDAAWLEAVRSALVNRTPDASPAADIAEPKAAEAKVAEPKPVEAKNTITAPLLRQAVREAPPMSLENVRVPPLMTTSTAAPLPPPTAVASAPAPLADDGHPVPPSAIPDPPPTDITPPENRSRIIGALISHIPFVGRALDR